MADETLNVFNADPVNDDVSLDTLVGEGKKYKDPNDLAKAYANADAHLMDLRADNTKLRAELDLLKANNSNKRPEDTPDDGNRRDDPPQPSPNSPAPKVDEDEFRNTLRRELQELNQEERGKKNMEDAARRLVDHYGDTAKANEAVRRRAAELGVSAEWLRDAAARSPQAFYASMGINESPNNRQTPAPRHEVNLNRGNLSGEKKYSDYAELRKTNKAKYYSVETQREMQAQAAKLGPAFYD